MFLRKEDVIVLDTLKYTKLFMKEELTMIAKSLTLYGFWLYPLKGKIAEMAVEIAMDRYLTISDASYVALAEKQNAKLYTADRKLIENINLDSIMHISDLSD